MAHDPSGTCLTDEDRELIADVIGCGCCSSRERIAEAFPDDCPRYDDGCDQDHNYGSECTHNSIVVIERIVNQKVQQALRAHAQSG